MGLKFNLLFGVSNPNFGDGTKKELQKFNKLVHLKFYGDQFFASFLNLNPLLLLLLLCCWRSALSILNKVYFFSHT